MTRLSVLLALLLALVTTSAVQAQTVLPLPTDSVALALAMIYAPGSDPLWWQDTVCALMTQGGCGYFRAYQAQTLWRAVVVGDWVEFTGSVTTLYDGSQVWRYRVHIYAADEVVWDVFVHVVDGKLNRILYGPYISGDFSIGGSEWRSPYHAE